MDSKINTINDYNQLLYDIYEREALPCLSDNEYTYKGQSVLGINNPAVVACSKIGLYKYLSEVTDILKKPGFNDMHAINEIIVSTADLKYRLGTLYLYQPYIVKLQNSFYYHKGEKWYYYDQTRNDGRFNRELPVAFESLYKFWQRLSDYLLHFFPSGLLACEGRSYFQTPFDYIRKFHPNLCDSENFKWLYKFSTEQYPIFNKKRKFFVHTAGYDNQFFKDYLTAHKSDEAIELLDQQRVDIVELLKEHLILCMEGYFKMMAFINEIEFSVKNDIGTNEFYYGLKPKD